MDRLTASDMFLLLWDDYGWSGDVGALALLDGGDLLDDAGRIRMDRARDHVEAHLHRAPRLRQVLYRPRRGLGWPLWVDAPSFDLANHVRLHELAASDDEDALRRACEHVARTPLDPARPLWELWLITGLRDRRVGAFLRLHHALADGPAAAAVFAALLEPSPDTPSPAAPSWTSAAMPTTRELLLDNLRRRRDELGRGCSGLLHPVATVRHARRTWPAWREVLTDERAPATSLNQPIGNDRRLALMPAGRIDATKDASHSHGGTVNDFVLAVVTGGLRQLLAQRGEDVARLRPRAMVTISLHDEGAAEAKGNKPGWMMVPLPVAEPDSARGLQQIARATREGKGKDRPQAGSGIFRFIAAQRLWYRQFPRQRSVNIVVTNVPGPPEPLYFAGARVLDVFPVMPLMGNLTIVVAALSYAGQLNLAATADRNLCPDLAVFVDGARAALEDLTHTTKVAAS